MNRLCAMAVALAFLSGCADRGPAQVETRDVKVAVAQPCATDRGERPALMTLPQLRGSLDTAPSVEARAKLVTTQLLLYMGWVPILEAAIQGCDARPASP